MYSITVPFDPYNLYSSLGVYPIPTWYHIIALIS